jgi:hypothetical protein
LAQQSLGHGQCRSEGDTNARDAIEANGDQKDPRSEKDEHGKKDGAEARAEAGTARRRPPFEPQAF